MIAIIPWILAIFILAFSNLSFAKTKTTSTYCKNPDFICYKVKSGESWKKLFKDPDQRDLVMRLNRINIHLYAGMHIAIPKNLETVSMLDLAPLPRQINPPGDKFIYVSLSDLVFGAYDAQGNLEYWGPVSGGKGYCPDIGRGCNTITGTYTIYRKEGSGCFSRKFPVGRGGAPMPYCMFFHGGFALHGSNEVPGYNASHGCVRLFVNDAKWLNEHFIQDKDDVHVVVRRN